MKTNETRTWMKRWIGTSILVALTGVGSTGICTAHAAGSIRLTSLPRISTSQVGSLVLHISRVRPMDDWAADTCGNNPSPDSCNNTNPGDDGCSSESRTVYTTSIRNQAGYVNGYLDLRYSYKCGTFWSRVRGVGAGRGLWKAVTACSDTECLSDGYEYGQSPALYSNQMFGECGTAYGYIYSNHDQAWEGGQLSACKDPFGQFP